MTTFSPLTGIHLDQAKEQFSVSVVQGICAQAGLNYSKPTVDNGIDLEITANDHVDLNDPAVANVKIAFQIKSSTEWAIKNDILSYRLKQKNYKQLIKDNLYRPNYLILYALPDSVADWIVSHEDKNIVSKAPYWVSIAGEEDRSTKYAKTSRIPIDIPIVQRFDASSLQVLFDNAAARYR